MVSRHRLPERFAFDSRAVPHRRLRRRPVLELLEGRALLATFTVTNAGDVGIGSNDAGDLRYCINEANADNQANTIVFDSTAFATPQTITLAGSQLELEDTGGTQTITGPAAGVTISGGGQSRVFQIDGGVTASISGLTISGGSTSGENGGGLANYGTATLTGCTLSGNSAALTYYNGYFSGGDGGGVVNGQAAPNFGNGYGAASLTMTDCTLSGNSAAEGGGVSNSATAYLALTDCTLSGNSAAEGGGVSSSATAYLALTACTVSGNSAAEDGGLADYDGTAYLTDTIVAGNTGYSGASDIGADSSGSGSNNLFGTGGSGGLTNGSDGNIVLTSLTDLGLAPLGNYGGPTQTIALLPGSPAIGAGSAVTGVTTDQRGLPLDSPNPDIGAYQFQPTAYSLIVTTQPPGSVTAGTGFGLTITAEDSSGNVDTSFDGTVTLALDSSPTGSVLGGTLTVTAQSGVASFSDLTLNKVGTDCTLLVFSNGEPQADTDAFNVTAAAATQLVVTTQPPSAVTTGMAFGLTVTADDSSGNVDPTFNGSVTVALLDNPGGATLGGSLSVAAQSGVATFSGLSLDDAGAGYTLQVSSPGLTTATTGAFTVYDPTIYTVDLTSADGTGSGNAGDLVYVVGLANANMNPGGSEIEFDPSVFSTPQTIELGATLGLTETAGPEVIDAPGAGLVTVSGGGTVGVFEVDSGVTATISGLTISDGSTNSDGGGLENYGTATLTDCTLSGNSGGGGGAVFNGQTSPNSHGKSYGAADLTMIDCTLSGNSVAGIYTGGGGVFNSGTATLTDCTLSGNSASGVYGGGGVSNSGTITLTECTLSGNSAGDGGGGVFNSGTATLTDCTLSGNSGGSRGGGGVWNNGMAYLTGCTLSDNSGDSRGGGGVFNIGTANLTDCTLSANVTSGYGGGFANYDGTAALTDCTLSGNSASVGGGLYNSSGVYHQATVALTDTIVAGNTSPSAASDIGGPVSVSGSDNLVGTGGSGGLTNGSDGNIVLTSLTDLGLAPLGNYGGPTQTIALLPGSPAIGAGSAVTGVTTDQRGLPLDSPNPDIGSYQFQPTAYSLIVTTQPPGSVTAGTGFGLTITAEDSSGNVDTSFDGTVTLALDSSPTGSVLGGTLTVTAQSGVASFSDLTLNKVGTDCTLLVFSNGEPQAATDAFNVTAAAATQLVVTTQPPSAVTTGIGFGLVVTALDAFGNVDSTFGGSVSVALLDNPGGAALGGSLSVAAQSGVATFSGLSLDNADTGYTLQVSSPGLSTATTGVFTVYPPATIYTVDLTSADGTGSGNAGDLVYVVGLANANMNPGGSEIEFDPSVFSTPQTITLGATLGLTDTAGPEVIDAPGAGLVTVSGGGDFTVLYVASGVTASISGLTITGGSTTGGNGGGLANYGTATLTDCTISGNTAAASYTYGYYGVISSSGGSGGGVFNSGTANLTLTDCTISGNQASVGGGVSNSGTANLTACTVSGNSSPFDGGGLASYGPAGPANLIDTIVAGNTDSLGASDIGGSDVSGSDNLIGTGGSGGLVNGQSGNIVLTSLTDLGLAPLGNYGGPTQTIALLPGSPALGAGVIADYPGTTTPITTDQRGEPLDSPNPDIGAFQSQGFTFTSAVGSTPQSAATGTAFANPLAVTVTANNPIEPVAGAILTFAAPAIGPSAQLSATTVTIGSDGVASVTATANGKAGSYTVTASAGGQGTYFALTNTTGSSLTPLPFSGITNQSITYGTSSVTISGTLANGSQAPVGESVAVTMDGDEQPATIGSGGAFSTTFNDDGLAVAGSPYTVNYAYTSDGSFASASTTSTLTVNPATLTITAKSETKVYGTDDPALAYTASGFQWSDTAASVLTGALARAQAGTLAGEQAGSHAISQGTLAADANYTIAFSGNTLTITPAPLTVTAHAQSKVYGTDDLALTETATGFVDTTVDGVTLDDTAATVLTGQLSRTPGETVSGGPYAITQGTLAASNYKITFTGSTLTIAPAPLSVAANPQTKVYGTDDPTLTESATGFVDTTVDGVTIDDTPATALTGQLARTPGETVSGGPYAISQGTLAADSNYKITFIGSTLAITPAPLTVTANPQTKVYGTADPELTETATGFVDTMVDGVTNDDTPATALTGQLARTPGETVSGGPYPITQGTLAADSNYAVSFTGSTLAITPAPLSVTTNPETKVYGTDDPALTENATGIVDTTVDGVTIDDTAATALTGELARTPGETVSGGPYAITQGTLAADSNYTITFTGSTLSISPAPLSVTANPQTKVYGTDDPSLTVAAMGFVNAPVDGVTLDDTAATVLSGQLARTPGETVSGGPYAITQGTLAANSNYTIAFTAGALTITPATLTVTAKPETKVFGSADPALAYTATGFQFGDTAATVLSGHLSRAAGQTVAGGPYTITQGTLAADGNYTIQFNASTLTITPATPVVNETAPGGTYTGALIRATATVTASGSTAAPNLEGVTPTLTYYAGSGTSGTNLGSTAPSAAGTYTVVAGFPGSADFASAQSKPTTFTIAPARATIVLEPHAVFKGKKVLKGVELTATIEPSVPGGGVPTGTVTFEFLTKHGKKVKATTLGTAALNGGAATLTFKPNKVLNQRLLIVYSGDPDFLASTISPPKLTKSEVASSRI